MVFSNGWGLENEKQVKLINAKEMFNNTTMKKGIIIAIRAILVLALMAVISIALGGTAHAILQSKVPYCLDGSDSNSNFSEHSSSTTKLPAAINVTPSNLSANISNGQVINTTGVFANQLKGIALSGSGSYMFVKQSNLSKISNILKSNNSGTCIAFNFSDIPVNGDRYSLFSFSDQWDNGDNRVLHWGVESQAAGSTYRIFLDAQLAGSPDGRTIATSSTFVVDEGNDTYVCLGGNGTAYVLYVNGQFQDLTITDTPYVWLNHTTNNFQSLVFGAAHDFQQRFRNNLNGWISQVFFWNSTMTPEDFNAAYNNSRPLTCEVLLGQNASAQVADTTIPIINASLNSSTIRINNAVNLSANTTDETGLSSCTFGINQTGATIFYNKSVTGTSDKCSQNFTISAGRGTIINFSVMANDTSGNKNLNSTIITVANTVPSSPTILTPINDKLFNTQPMDINWTGTADVDGDTLTLYIWINGTLNQTTTTNTTFNASNGKYNITVSLFDGFGSSANVSINSFKIDTLNPVITIGTNKTINQNSTFILNASDANLFGFNCSIYNGTLPSNGTLTSAELLNISNTGGLARINLTLNTTNGDKEYRIACSASDDHTAKNIEDYTTIKDNSKKQLIFKTVLENNASFAIIEATAFENKGDSSKTKVLNLDFIKVDTNKVDNQSYSIEFNYTKPESKYTYFNYKINLTASEKLYPRDSSFKGLFATKNNWIDFEPANEVTIEQVSDFNYIVTIGINNTDVKLKSIGGVNVVYANMTLKVDTVTPLLNSFNLTNQSYFRLNQTILGICTDSNVFNFTQRIYSKTTGNDVNRTFNTTTNGGTTLRMATFLDLQAVSDGNYTWDINCSDTHTGSGFPDLNFDFANGNITFYKKDNPSKNVTIGVAVLVNGQIVGLSASQISTFNVTRIIENSSDRINFGAEFDIPSQISTIFGLKIPKLSGLSLVDQDQNFLFMLHDNYWMDFKTSMRLRNGSKYPLTTQFIETANFYGVYWNITWADYNLTAGNHTSLITESIGGLNRVNAFYDFAVDTTPPTFVSASNRTADSSNSTSITTATNVNLSIFGLDDLYLSTGNFSENASGSWVNHSITMIGNNTPYNYIVGSGNFTAGQVVGWKFYVFDIAGNLLDPIYTFSVGAPSTPKSGGGSDGGSTSSITIPQTLLNPFGIEANESQCPSKQQLLDGRCYPCDPETGYLWFNSDDRSVNCIQCSEGFRLSGKQCILKEPVKVGNKINAFIDNLANKISSNIFGTSNPLLGFITLFSAAGLAAYYGINYLKRK